jgi:hypothetical protein
LPSRAFWLAARQQDLPLGDTRGQRLGGLSVHKPLVLCLAPGFSLRHRDVRGLPPLLDRVPAVQGGLRRHAVPGQHVAGDPLGVPGGGPGACIQQDLRFPRAGGDATVGLATDVFLDLTQGKGLLRLSGLRIADRDGDAPVIAVCHGMTQRVAAWNNHIPDSRAVPGRPAQPEGLARSIG